MNNQSNNDTFLAQWLAGELSEKELQLFKQDPDYPFYQQLAEQSSHLTIPAIDQKVLLHKIKAQQKTVKQPQAKQRFLNRRILIVAATLLFLILGYSIFFRQSENTLYTTIGEQLAHVFPEGSKVLLNSNSSLNYHPSDFNNNRTLELKGEAFFEVNKGANFTVATNQGKVEVLGTSFSVYSRAETMIVACKSGKVRVSNQGGQFTTLSQGERVALSQAILNKKEKVDPEIIAGWEKGVTRFESESLSIVAQAIENQFGVSITLAPDKASEKFTGSFLHKDIETALKMVFTPMGLEFKKDGPRKYIISN